LILIALSMTDEALMTAVKSGKLEQAAVLFERYHVRLYNFLARLAMDKTVGEDLTQNVFLRMLKYKHTYKESMRFQSWIYQLARNVFSDHYQSMKRSIHSKIEIEHIAEFVQEAESEAEEEREARLHQSLNRLSEEYRELLVLTRFQQLKYEEVAEILDTTVANIKVKVHRAMIKLREHYFQLEAYD
jgi:RNA polymerase sigma factor (sigma-70 family)